LLLFLLIILIDSSWAYSQNKGHVIGIDKLFVDANDPLYKQVQPGDTLYFLAGNRKYINVSNFLGSAAKPIVMINRGGEVIIDTDHYYGITIQNCRYVKFTGTGFPGQFYGFKIKKVTNGAGVSMGYLSSDVEIDHVSIENTLIGGLYAKTDPDCNPNTHRNAFTQYNTLIHDNYIAYTGDEGIYAGSTKYFGQTIKCNGKDTLVMPSLLDGVRIYNNILKYTGWDGIQVSSASKNSQIYNNTVLFDSQLETDSQMSGILIGGGSKCDCYNNFISQGKGVGIESHGLGGYRIFNNIIIDAGRSYQPNDLTKMKFGIFVSDISTQKDSSYSIQHNNIINPKSEGIRFSSIISKNNLIAANIIINPGNYDYYENGNTRFKGKDAYIMFQSTETTATLSSNYKARAATAVGFTSLKMEEPSDFKLIKGSPMIDSISFSPKTAILFDFIRLARPSGLKSDIGAYEYDTATSIGELKADIFGEVRLLQNPSINILIFRLPGIGYSEILLAIYSINGEMVLQRRQFEAFNDFTDIQADTSGIVPGVYLYTLRSNDHTYSGKFLKW